MKPKETKKHVTKISSDKIQQPERGCYFTIFNCDDHTCSTGNGQGCNTIIECDTANTGGSENNGVCKDNNYGGCVNTLACRPSANADRVPKELLEDDDSINAFIKSIAQNRAKQM